MSDVKPETQSAGPVTSHDPEREIQREDLRLDCLRLAAQRQGARDSRGLLEIAEEYFGWVTAESARRSKVIEESLSVPASIDWPFVKTVPVKPPATLSLGKKHAAVKTKSKESTRRPRTASHD